MEKHSYKELNLKVLKAADFLRRSIKSDNYGKYILGLLLLKRVSDVFEEVAEEIEKETGNEHLAWNDRDEHQFYVPGRARWNSIRKVSFQVGYELNRACAELEDVNPIMKGTLINIDFNSDELGDAKQRDATLLEIIQHISAVPMKDRDLGEPDLIGRICESLIEKYAKDTANKGVEFYTPRGIVKLLVALLDPQEGMRICDPTVGSGGTLIESADYVERNGGNPKNLTLCGQEKDMGTLGVCKINMILHGFPDADIRRGDVIMDPKFIEDGKLMLFDREIANPPFSPVKWGRSVAEEDRFGRFRYGLPPKTKGDLAFVEHMISSLDEIGKLTVVVPHGVLFRSGAEGRIRKNILKDDIVEAIVGLPPNLFYAVGIPAAVLVVNKNKPPERKGSVIFIDASAGYQQGRRQNTLRNQDIDKIVAAFRDYEDVDKYCRVVSLTEIVENDYSLNISRYVNINPENKPIDIDAALEELRALESRRREIEAGMSKYLKELGYEA